MMMVDESISNAFATRQRRFCHRGGWIDSIGRYIPDPSLTGPATFGFVSKYQKGATTPTGQTEFQFKVAGLNFHSTSYEWLVIAQSKALYKGEGLQWQQHLQVHAPAVGSQFTGGGAWTRSIKI
jgi:hypothetical protein